MEIIRSHSKKNKTASTSRFLCQQRKTCGFLFRNKIQCNYKEKSVLDLALGSSQLYSMNEVYILTTDKSKLIRSPLSEEQGPYNVV